MNDIEFKLKEEVVINIDESLNLITLRAGNIHINEITIEVNKNSRVNELLNNKCIRISSGDEEYEDMKQLYNYGFLDMKFNLNNNAMIFSRELPDYIQKILKLYNYSILYIEDLLGPNIKDMVEKNIDLAEMENVFSKYDFISVVNTLNDINISRVFNKIFINLDKPYNLLLIDNENIFISNIIPGISGCYGCFEKKVLSKKSEIKIKAEKNLGYDMNSLMVALGINNKNLENLVLYGMSSLTGNFLHFYLPLFEYNFDFNRRTILCTDCRKYNELQFEEQNIRSINLLKEVRSTNEIDKRY